LAENTNKAQKLAREHQQSLAEEYENHRVAEAQRLKKENETLAIAKQKVQSVSCMLKVYGRVV
jgi:hypothetical protein